jgi:hypothetical protein
MYGGDRAKVHDVVVQPRLCIVERYDGRLHVRGVHQLGLRETVTIGRDDAILIGVEPLDSRVSRAALDVANDGQAWHLTPRNRNGVHMYPWGQASRPLTGVETVSWPRVAVHVVGAPAYEHWVLLEDPGIPMMTSVSRPTTATERTPPPRPLTGKELAAVRSLFASVLAWPPRPTSVIPTLDTVARGLGIDPSTLKSRLDGVCAKASRLGTHRKISHVDPEYVYRLIRYGYIELTDADVDIALRATF